jgi:hypothetical protein
MLGAIFFTTLPLTFGFAKNAQPPVERSSEPVEVTLNAPRDRAGLRGRHLPPLDSQSRSSKGAGHDAPSSVLQEEV